MLATSGPLWFDRRRPEKTWPSFVVSVGITGALFVSAFLAMQTVGSWTGARNARPEPPVVVRLAPPPVAIPPRPRVARTPMPPPRAAPDRAPASIAPATAAPPIGVPAPVVPAAAPAPGSPPSRDTASARRKTSPLIPLIPRGPVPIARPGGEVPYTTPPGVAGSPSGVTIGSRIANTQAYRDSMLETRLNTFAEMASTHPPTGAELAALRQSQQTALMTYHRASTSGNPNVHVQQGEGMGGEGAIGGSPLMGGGHRSSTQQGATAGGGFSLPLLSRGPSAAQRKRNAAIDKDYRMGLRRLEDRMLLKRDSLRLDSLRRDSLARRRP